MQKVKKGISFLLQSIVIVSTFNVSIATAEQNRSDALMFAYDKFDSSWLMAEMMIACDDDYWKFKLTKNAFGKRTLYRLSGSKWQAILNADFDGYRIDWKEVNKEITASHITQNYTLCGGNNRYNCGLNTHFDEGHNQFVNSWFWRYKPSLYTKYPGRGAVRTDEFEKYFTITSTANINNSLILDEAYFYRRFENNVRQINVKISKNADNLPKVLNQKTKHQYEIQPFGSGLCRLIR